MLQTWVWLNCLEGKAIFNVTNLGCYGICLMWGAGLAVAEAELNVLFCPLAVRSPEYDFGVSGRDAVYINRTTGILQRF